MFAKYLSMEPKVIFIACGCWVVYDLVRLVLGVDVQPGVEAAYVDFDSVGWFVLSNMWSGGVVLWCNRGM